MTLALGGAPATAAVRFVDGACATSGNGSSLACGESGPFRTVAEGVLAMQPGDTLNVRGAHGGFDGVYFESLALRNGASPPGKALACTAAAPCTIQGCRAAACGAEEVPILRGMRPRADWTAAGSGIWRRTMEATPDPDDQVRDAFDPMILVQGTGTPLTMLAYSGDAVSAPADGHWSYHPATHEIYVNPPGSADPSTVQVPYFTNAVLVRAPTAYVTLQHLRIEGSRSKIVYLDASVGAPLRGMVLRDVTERYAHRFFVLADRDTPGLLIEDSVAEYGCRGSSWFRTTGDGCYGYRLFGVHGGTVRRNVVRHIGAAGRYRISCGCTNGWPCLWCDAPWSDPTWTYMSAGSTAYDIKQTNGLLLEDNVAEDISHRGLHLDVSRHVTARRNRISGATIGISVSNQTPSGGCPSTGTSQYCANCDDVLEDNVVEDTGRTTTWLSCGLQVTDTGLRHADCSGLARITNTDIIAPYRRAVCVPTLLPLDLSIVGTLLASGTTSTTTVRASTTTTTLRRTSAATPSETDGLLACGGGPDDAGAVAAARASAAAQCDCVGARSHGRYVACVSRIARAAVADGSLRAVCKAEVMRCATRSTCGRRGWITCCRTDARGRDKCGPKHDASRCRAPSGGTACVSTATSCCEACGAAGTCNP